VEVSDAAAPKPDVNIVKIIVANPTTTRIDIQDVPVARAVTTEADALAAELPEVICAPIWDVI
jgi:hypothetical protein